MDTCTGNAECVRRRGREDYDSASRPRFPSRGRPVASRCRAAGSGAVPREIGREYEPIHGAECDRFRSDAQRAADSTKSVSGDNPRDQRPFSGVNSIRCEVPSPFALRRERVTDRALFAVARSSRLWGWQASCLPVWLRIRQARRPAAPQTRCLCYEIQIRAA